MNKIDLAKWIIKDLRKNNYSIQIEEFILDKIKSHALQPGEELPSIRQLADAYNINRNTVLRVYTKLISKGYLTNTQGSSTKVSFNQPNLFHNDKVNNTTKIPILGYLQFDPLRIKKIWTSAKQNFVSIGPNVLNEACSAEKVLSKYASKYREHHIELTQAQKINSDNSGIFNGILEHLNVTRSFDFDETNLHLINGRYDSIKSIFNLLVLPGDRVVNACPGDLLISWVLKESGVKSIKLDPSEINFVKTLRNHLKQNVIKALYIRLGSTYPKGKAMNEDTCFQLIELAKKYHFIIIEEDEDHEFWFGESPYKHLINYQNDGHVIYSGALSRLSPYMNSLQTIVAPSQVIPLLKKSPSSIYEYRNWAEEMAIAEILKSGELAMLSRKARKLKERDLYNMHSIFQEHLSEYIKYDLPENGLIIWLEFNTQVNLAKVLTILSRSGFQIPYYPEQQRYRGRIHNMRLNFSLFNENECRQAAIRMEKIFGRYIEPMANEY